jgi:hypothetical protein
MAVEDMSTEEARAFNAQQAMFWDEVFSMMRAQRPEPRPKPEKFIPRPKGRDRWFDEHAETS